jgi:UDP-apiose/xylose synthase
MQEETTHFILGPVAKQRWTYACAKQLMERVVYAYGHEQGLEYTIVRPFNFIGPRMDYLPTIEGDGTPRVLACFMDALVFHKPLQLVDGGHHRRVFTGIDDAVDAVLRMVHRPEKCRGKIFNIGNPANEVSIRELAELMQKLYPEVSGQTLNKKCVLRDVGADEFYGPGYDDSDRRIPDITLAKKLLGWQPQTSLTDALKKAMTGYIRQSKTMPAIIA